MVLIGSLFWRIGRERALLSSTLLSSNSKVRHRLIVLFHVNKLETFTMIESDGAQLVQSSACKIVGKGAGLPTESVNSYSIRSRFIFRLLISYFIGK